MRTLTPIIMVAFGSVMVTCATGESGTPMLVIRGRVIDARTREPVAPANITLLETDTGVVTVTGGVFELRVRRPRTQDLTLLVRHIGHVPKEIPFRVGPDSVHDLGTIRIQWAQVQVETHIDSQARR